MPGEKATNQATTSASGASAARGAQAAQHMPTGVLPAVQHTRPAADSVLRSTARPFPAVLVSSREAIPALHDAPAEIPSAAAAAIGREQTLTPGGDNQEPGTPAAFSAAVAAVVAEHGSEHLEASSLVESQDGMPLRDRLGYDV